MTTSPGLPTTQQIVAALKVLIQLVRSLAAHLAVFAGLFNVGPVHSTPLRIVESVIGGAIAYVDHQAPSGAASPK